MKKRIAFLSIAALFAVSTVFALPSTVDPSKYKLVWGDERTGPKIDTDYWTFEVGRGSRNDGWGNQEWEYYTDGANLTFADGASINEARRETANGPWSTGANPNYTATRLSTSGKVSFKYGYLEVKLKAPEGDGLWPAFWTLGESINDPLVGWPTCGEMELYEARTGTWQASTNPDAIGDDFFIGTCHFTGATGTSYNSKGKAYTESLGKNYHLYGILWDSAHVEYYFDDQVYWSKLLTPNINQPTNFKAFHNPHFFIENIAIMGNYVSGSNISLGANTLPAHMSIDWVRIYQNPANGATIALAKPFNGSGVKSSPAISGLTRPSSAQFKVYDLKGRLVADFTNQVRAMKAGLNPMQMLRSSLPTGTYVARLVDDGKMFSQKLATTR